MTSKSFILSIGGTSAIQKAGLEPARAAQQAVWRRLVGMEHMCAMPDDKSAWLQAVTEAVRPGERGMGYCCPECGQRWHRAARD